MALDPKWDVLPVGDVFAAVIDYWDSRFGQRQSPSEYGHGSCKTCHAPDVQLAFGHCASCMVRHHRGPITVNGASLFVWKQCSLGCHWQQTAGRMSNAVTGLWYAPSVSQDILIPLLLQPGETLPKCCAEKESN